MFLSVCCLASRWTRLSSVPTAHDVPGSAVSRVWMMYSVEPTRSALRDDLVPALGVHDHLDAGDPRAYVVDRRRP